jgi:hypothetical protein
LTGIGLTAIEVRVTDLAKPGRTGKGRMTDISKSGMGVTVPFEVAAGDIVQLNIEDSTLFGFVVHARQEAECCRAGIEIQRVLIGGSDLSRVLQLALRQALPEVPGLAAGGLFY